MRYQANGILHYAAARRAQRTEELTSVQRNLSGALYALAELPIGPILKKLNQDCPQFSRLHSARDFYRRYHNTSLSIRTPLAHFLTLSHASHAPIFNWPPSQSAVRDHVLSLISAASSLQANHLRNQKRRNIFKRATRPFTKSRRYNSGKEHILDEIIDDWKKIKESPDRDQLTDRDIAVIRGIMLRTNRISHGRLGHLMSDHKRALPVRDTIALHREIRP